MINLELERRKRGLTLSELGKQVKMNTSELSRIENGRTIPFPGHLKRLSKFFNLPGDDLLKDVRGGQATNPEGGQALKEIRIFERELMEKLELSGYELCDIDIEGANIIKLVIAKKN